LSEDGQSGRNVAPAQREGKPFLAIAPQVTPHRTIDAPNRFAFRARPKPAQNRVQKNLAN
jgi:hypothetical protein